MSFEQLGLSQSIFRALRTEGYESATPIQSKAIPIILGGSDLMGCAQTGTGKTAAFALPTLHRLDHSSGQGSGKGGKRGAGGRPIRTLVLVPTRELAAQVAASFTTYARFTSLRTGVVYGGVSQYRQVRTLQNGIDVLVATPGRLLDLINQGHISLQRVETLILDEADQMLDMGFLPDLRKIVGMTPAGRQTLMFSATMPTEIRRLATRWLSAPKFVQVAPISSPVESVDQSVYFVESRHKPQLLTHYLQSTACERTLVFARTKHGADKIVKLLVRAGIRAAAIHGNKSQNARTRTLEQFKSKQPPVLVATDIAARGLDIEAVSHVINYELPEVPEIYVHRIGRTGRAGASGIATSFCGADEHSRLRQIERLTRHALVVQEGQPQYTGTSAPAGRPSNTTSRRPRTARKPGSSKADRSTRRTGTQAGKPKRHRAKRRPGGGTKNSARTFARQAGS